MAEDIRIHVDFLIHHKTRRLKRKLGSDAVLALLTLFCYAGKFRPGGVLKGMDAEDIADASGWGGDASGFVSELCDIGFIEQCDEGIYSIHDWEEHNPWAAGAEERRAMAAKAGKASAEAKRKSKEYNDIQTDANGTSTEANGPLKSVATELQRNVNGSSTEAQRELNGTPTPSPSPSPSPTPGKLEEKIQGASAPARDHGPAEDPGKPEQPEAAKPKPHARFSPPTVEQVQARILEQCYLHADAEGFVNFYASKGWMVGKSPMKDWGAALAGWEARAKTAASDSSSPQGRFGKRTGEQIVADVCAGCI